MTHSPTDNSRPNPLRVTCPVCDAPPAQHCTRAAARGRGQATRTVAHEDRYTLAAAKLELSQAV